MLFMSLARKASCLSLISSVVAQLPYNPARLILAPDKSKVYQFFSQPSQASFSYFDISKQLTSSSAPIAINQVLPFEIADKAFVPIADNEGFTVVVGDCEDVTEDANLWRFNNNKDGNSGTWKELQLEASETRLTANFLSAGFSFSTDGSTASSSLYVFGGMCPDDSSNETSWVSQATYSNTMLSLSATADQSPYELSVTGTRAPPIAEAGLTITPLSLITTKSSAGKVSQQQNFVLLGGHTQNAFINMSQVALFSLPEASWAFIGVDQPGGGTGELVKRDVTVEPRSGHTAVLTEDGTKIVVFGGWVGNVSNPATPQLAVLQLGQGYGGTSAWEWTIPKQTDYPLSSEQGLYGHGAVMLPGNVMMISGGTSIKSETKKRSSSGYMFYNANTGSWSSTYKNSASNGPGGLNSSQKVGIGAGLGLGLTAVAAVVIVWWLYRRKLLKKRTERERHLRELAFGSERFQSSSRVGSRLEGRFSNTAMRSASWGNKQEQSIESSGFHFPWSVQSHSQGDEHRGESYSRNGVERTGAEMDVPSPTRGLRKSLSTRGPVGFGANFSGPVTGPGSVFRIDEVEEEGSLGSTGAKTPTGSRMSDPFKDPPNLEPTTPAEERRREVQGWVDDWQSAAASISISRHPSQLRAHSSLSQAQDSSDSSSYRTGRESPERSDRTGSNLSEKSQFSLQRSLTGTVSRQISQRSVSAGYALFAGAAAAMSRLGGSNKETTLERAASKRSISLNTCPPRRAPSNAQGSRSGESRSLLGDQSPTKSICDESPIKDYKNHSRTSSLASQKKKMGVFGSVKRVFTGTSQVDVQAQVGHYEEKADDIVRSKSEMSENAAGPAFWRGKKGAKDWDEDEQPSMTLSNNRRSTIGSTVGEYDGEDWDVETAVQKRVVQVMFTVPKEKLRVVNADALSLISRSDVDEKEDRERSSDIKRMSSVREDDNAGGGDDETGCRRREDTDS